MATNTRRNASSRRFSEPGSFWGLWCSVKGCISTSFSAPGHSTRAPEDCNAATATGPVPLHERIRDRPRPRLRTPSMWEHNGKLAEAEEKPAAYRTSTKPRPRISFPPPLLDDTKKLIDFHIQPGKPDIQNRFSRVHHYIHRARQLRQAPSDSGPQTAANAVALHGAAQRLTHG